MLDNWLSPVNTGQIFKEELETAHLGYHLLVHTKELGLPDLSNCQIAIMGLKAKSSNLVRKYLYKLSYPFQNLKIADLGNFRKHNLDFVIGALAEVQASGLLPVLIGEDQAFIQACYKALMMNYNSINVAVIDEKVAINPERKNDKEAYLNPIVFGKEANLFQLGLIGFQYHFIAPPVYQFIQNTSFDLVRLGDARADLVEVEPIIRDADLVGINLSAIRSSDLPAVNYPSPSGFSIEECCRLARYSGMSDKLKGFCILGYNKMADPLNQSAFAIAQILWYFIDGFYHRKGDFPITTEGLIEYIVELKKYDYQLTFWKSKWTGRWWIQVPVKIRRKHLRHRLVPCSHADYKMASADELPDRLIKAFKRFA